MALKPPAQQIDGRREFGAQDRPALGIVGERAEWAYLILIVGVDDRLEVDS